MLEFFNLTKKPIRRAVFVALYKKIFKNERFELSVVFANPAFMKKLNVRYRKKNNTANVLSFLLDKGHGEIFLNSTEKNVTHLFVHGCLHLKGYDHENEQDATYMEHLEQKILNS